MRGIGESKLCYVETTATNSAFVWSMALPHGSGCMACIRTKCCDRSIFNLHPSNSQHHCAPTHCKCSDYDEDCAEGLVCWYDEDETGELPPGCAGTPQPGSEYCIDPRAPPYVFPKILKDRVGLDACVGDW